MNWDQLWTFFVPEHFQIMTWWVERQQIFKNYNNAVSRIGTCWGEKKTIVVLQIATKYLFRKTLGDGRSRVSSVRGTIPINRFARITFPKTRTSPYIALRRQLACVCISLCCTTDTTDNVSCMCCTRLFWSWIFKSHVRTQRDVKSNNNYHYIARTTRSSSAVSFWSVASLTTTTTATSVYRILWRHIPEVTNLCLQKSILKLTKLPGAQNPFNGFSSHVNEYRFFSETLRNR